ncbi:hypothetical protein M413DRAFT_441664 [Hebeloma cylindrosporum]|uniref:C2 domain-containing protein n=1 Tax=Hebeloma cylindrosporum TaxID=76867 RepID=A0A0C2Z031_HEBCY|nr:hypothetical protein M413DRAFT_441664 [Hebeloma cylindrosporum h7]
MSLYHNPLHRPIQLGRYERVLIIVLHANDLPFVSDLHIVIKVDDTTHKTRTSGTSSCNPTWSEENFIAPRFRGSFLVLEVFHGKELLGITQAPLERILNAVDCDARQTCTLKLCTVDEMPRSTGTVTLHLTRLPLFIAASLPQYHLPPSSSCPLLSSPVFNPPAHEIRRILETMEPSLVTPRFASVGESLFVKYGSRISIREAMALVYIKQRTSIPVPEVRLCFQDNEKTYIVMDRIKGRTLDDCLKGSTITNEQLRSVAAQLGDFVLQLRSLDAKKSMGSWPSGPFDNLFFDPPPLCEFQDMAEFHSYWIWRLGSHMGLPEIPSALRENQPCKVVLTHGDLAPRNILVDGGEITGVVDWETLGWYPDFWERMAASRVLETQQWQDELSIALGPINDLSAQYPAVLGDTFFRPWADLF